MMCQHFSGHKIKCQLGFRKTRYRGLAKNASQVNLYLLRKPLIAT
ncbi:MAG: hypothetical protein WAW36_04250 [Methylovulum miyakonense]